MSNSHSSGKGALPLLDPSRVVASGTDSLDRSMPTKSRNDGLSVSASLTPLVRQVISVLHQVHSQNPCDAHRCPTPLAVRVMRLDHRQDFLPAMPERTGSSAASRVCCAGLAPTFDLARGRQSSCPTFWRRQISAVCGRCCQSSTQLHHRPVITARCDSYRLKGSVDSNMPDSMIGISATAARGRLISGANREIRFDTRAS